MQSARYPSPRAAGGNFFRGAWTYQRLPAGDAALAAGRGLSPAFTSLLDAVPVERPVSFSELARIFPRLHADDLELWLAELCRMAMIAPAAQLCERRAANEVNVAASASVPVPDQRAPAGAPAASVTTPSAQASLVPAAPAALAGTHPAPASASVDWKLMSLDSLYAHLVAICAELEAREQPALA
jgi:hypothetical protein